MAVGKSINEVSNVVLVVVLSALIIGSLLAADAFTGITIINVTALSATYGTALTVITGFLGLVLTIVAIVWIVGKVKPLMSKGGLNMGA